MFHSFLQPAAKASITLFLLCFFIFPVKANETLESDVKKGEPLTLNMQDADIGALIETVSYITGKNFIVDPRVTGKVTIISSVPTEPDRIYDLFLSVLRIHGFAAVEAEGVIKIVPDASAKFEDVPQLTNGNDFNDEISTLVIKLNNVSANELVPILRPLMPQSGHLAAHNDSNMLIAADSASNLARLRRIISRIDIADNEQAIEVIRLQHANAADLVRVIQPVLQAQTQQAEPVKKRAVASIKNNLVADERTNSLLLSGDEKTRLQIRALITHLDTPVENLGDTEVIYLNYAVASEVVPILQSIGGKLGVTDEEKQKNPKATTANQDTLFEIEADDNVNALIVHAPYERMQALKSVIKQLDIRRAQVLVEGIIAEVSYNKSVELGIEWQSSVPNSGTFVSSTPSSSGSAFDPLSIAAGGLGLGFFNNGSLRGLLRAIASDSYSNILSTPTLMTMDNEEAEIVIGQNVPFVTGQFTNSTTTGNNPFQTIEREDVGIVLKVKPQINEGDSVSLEIEQEISDVVDSSVNSASGITTNKRSIKTKVLVDNQNIVVLGGLLSDDISESVNKVPVLGDIPLLGNLFKNTNDNRVKNNLMIFLRPQIVRDARTNSNLTVNKYNFIKDEQTSQDSSLTLMPSTKMTELPEFEDVDRSSRNFIKSDIRNPQDAFGAGKN